VLVNIPKEIKKKTCKKIQDFNKQRLLIAPRKSIVTNVKSKSSVRKIRTVSNDFAMKISDRHKFVSKTEHSSN
jgi:hypothetical protein